MTNFHAIVKATRAAAAAQRACSEYKREATRWRDEGDSHRRLAARYPDGEPHNMGCLEAAATCDKRADATDKRAKAAESRWRAARVVLINNPLPGDR
ncbi:hypothetical protein UFOVP1302_34 [uncultured Caudovirales phage]|uniref:Uncharacterized protein n=1 Tax=uncultured Caudovirales phage TaxID=2100421 RepID=A0A6J5PCE8_9CAUD|nr:hypothetical protein UFOVP895_37 [uncultured Caudovirales phage]CAB4181601.1 hypothetical protein UFOVP1070_50 [uncultured Caudovirales phage]CAB4195790.1 hypothetical protein UFOVP1302_34 [uncultured Caudovirales phage]CAB4211961.1 hypothetical protein UFOVP1416_78 [uncultured Caudovirales phage]